MHRPLRHWLACVPPFVMQRILRRCLSSSASRSIENMRVLFMGTDDVAVPSLRKLQQLNQLEIDVLCPAPRQRFGGRVVETTPVQMAASELGLRSIEIPSGTRKLGRWLREMDPLAGANGGYKYDIGVVVSFGYFIPKSLLRLLRLGSINMHPSLLPRHRGASPIAGTLLSGDRIAGVSVCMIHPEVFDKGSVVRQAEVPLTPFDTHSTLRPRLAEAGGSLTGSVMNHLLEHGELPSAMDQDEAAVTWTRKTTPEDGIIAPAAKGGDADGKGASDHGGTADLGLDEFIRRWRGHDGMIKTVFDLRAPGKGDSTVRVTVTAVRYPPGWAEGQPHEQGTAGRRSGEEENTDAEGHDTAPVDFGALLQEFPPPPEPYCECSDPVVAKEAWELLRDASVPALLLHKKSKTVWLGLHDGCIELRGVKASKGKAPKAENDAPTAFRWLQGIGFRAGKPLEIVAGKR